MSDIEITTKTTITVGDQTLTLTLEQLKELRDQIDGLLPKSTPLPTRPQDYNPPPWRERPHPFTPRTPAPGLPYWKWVPWADPRPGRNVWLSNVPTSEAL